MINKDQIRNLISKGKTKEAIALFSECLSSSDAELSNDLISLSGRLNTLNDKTNKGLINQDDENTEGSKITNSVLNFLKTWDESDSTSLLDRMIAELSIDKDADLGLLSLVNCDRIGPVKKFNRNFEEKKELKQPFQFYFLCGCPDEKPDSIAERFVYEIIEKEDLDLNKSVSYPYLEQDSKRLKVENLPLGIDVAGSRKKLKEYVQKRFAFTNTESFETFIDTGIPKLPHNYIFTVFKITETDWEDAEEDIFSFLQWMINTFKCVNPRVPTFLFMFVVQIRNLYDSEKVSRQNAEIVTNLETFCAKNVTAVLKEIAPIKTVHFTDWLDKLGVNNVNDSENLINIYSKTLNAKDRFTINGETRFHMKNIEPLQKKIVEAFRNKI